MVQKASGEESTVGSPPAPPEDSAQEPEEELAWNEIRVPSGLKVRLRQLSGQDDAAVDEIIIQKGWVTPTGVIPDTVAYRTSILRSIDRIDDQPQRIMTSALMDSLLLMFTKMDLAALVRKYSEVQIGQTTFRP